MWSSAVTQEAYMGSSCPQKSCVPTLNAKETGSIRFIYLKVGAFFWSSAIDSKDGAKGLGEKK